MTPEANCRKCGVLIYPYEALELDGLCRQCANDEINTSHEPITIDMATGEVIENEQNTQNALDMNISDYRLEFNPAERRRFIYEICRPLCPLSGECTCDVGDTVEHLEWCMNNYFAYGEDLISNYDDADPLDIIGHNDEAMMVLYEKLSEWDAVGDPKTTTVGETKPVPTTVVIVGYLPRLLFFSHEDPVPDVAPHIERTALQTATA
jgi:hypothetical protein